MRASDRFGAVAVSGGRRRPCPQRRPATGSAAGLPPLESLTIDSDFSPFMQPGVDADVRRSALRKLLRDPRFNVMDGLDVYIDDYSMPSPIEPELARTLMQARYIFDPPQTRVNARGHRRGRSPTSQVAAMPLPNPRRGRRCRGRLRRRRRSTPPMRGRRRGAPTTQRHIERRNRAPLTAVDEARRSR